MMRKAGALFLFWALLRVGMAAPPYVDEQVYAPLELTWSSRSEIKNAVAVFPHPVLLDRAVLTTADGASQTDDGGRTWKAWSGAAKMGRIRAVAFDPVATGHFLIAANGLWQTSDHGATFSPLATTKNGLAADTVADVIFYSGDPGGGTLLAVHGEAAPGLSRSRDGGKTWDVVNQDYFFHRVLGGESNEFKRLFLFGAAKDEPDVMGLFMSTTPGEYVSELMRDVLLTDIAFSPVAEGDVLFATSDKGAYRITGGRSSVGQEMIPLPMAGISGWASLAVAWGPNADVLHLCGYDPAKAGLVISSDDLKTSRTFTNGVLVGPLVKEGAAIRPNANGTIFYAVANGALSIGRAGGVPRVVAEPAALQLSQDDPTFNDVREAFATFAKTADGRFGAAAQQVLESFGDLEAPFRKRRLTVTASVPEKAASVVIDLSRAGGTPATPMFDDGRHDDGAANDGTFGITFAYEGKRPQFDRRPGAPGRVPLGVAALSAEGKRTGAVALVGVYTKIASFDMWGEKRGNVLATESEGEVSVRPVFNPANIHGGSPCLRIEPRTGAWSVSIVASRRAHDVTGYDALSFWIRTEPGSEPPATLNVQFSDKPDLSEPVTTPPVPIIPDLIDQGALGPEYRRVIAPLTDLPTSGFQPSRLSRIIISGEAKSPSTLFLDGVRFHATRAELDAP